MEETVLSNNINTNNNSINKLFDNINLSKYNDTESIYTIIVNAYMAGQQNAVEGFNMNLDNEIPSTIDIVPCLEGDLNMASNMNKTYTYLDDNNSIKTIRLFGKSKKELDLKFQKFLATPQVENSPTVAEVC